MKTECNFMPETLSLEQYEDGNVEIIFRENIEQVQRDGETFYTYDEYRTQVPYRENLLQSVSASKALWLARAQEEESKRNTPVSTIEEQITDMQLALCELYERGVANNG